VRQPEIYTANTLRQWGEEVPKERNGNYYIPARPVGHNLYPVLHRLKVAWQVFIGKYDAVNWENPND